MYKRIVIKFGTSVLTGGTQQLDRAHMVELVRQCVSLYRQGRDVIIVTSGAIVAGQEQLTSPELSATVAGKQVLAAVGQSRLMLVWETLFDLYDIRVGQMLLTRADVKDRRRFLNAHDMLHELLGYRIIPIINENDAVATAEIKVGDNDNLSALAVLLAEADLLLLLTDQPGLFTADPRTDPNAQIIPEVHAIDETLRRLAGSSISGLGVGGMSTKLQAADVARRAGADVVIAAGRAPDIITRIVIEGENIGTHFPALETPLESRKRWIFGGTTAAGRLIIDSGAERALVENGKSLLPAGIRAVEGDFERGDTVLIIGPQGNQLAQGIARYDSYALTQIMGYHSDEIAERLGYTAGPVAVHRNDMIVL